MRLAILLAAMMVACGSSPASPCDEEETERLRRQVQCFQLFHAISYCEKVSHSTKETANECVDRQMLTVMPGAEGRNWFDMTCDYEFASGETQ